MFNFLIKLHFRYCLDLIILSLCKTNRLVLIFWITVEHGLCPEAPVDKFFLQLIDRAYDGFPPSPDCNNLTNLVVVEHLSGHFSLCKTQLKKLVHITILPHIFLEAKAVEDGIL